MIDKRKDILETLTGDEEERMKKLEAVPDEGLEEVDGGINNTEFVYSVRVYGNQFQRQFHPEGYIEEGIYESNIFPI